jgi:hypothetical protein
MGGGLMQLVAYGAQDIYLTGNPQITFFKVVYRRHTNFSMETIQQTISGSSTISTDSGNTGTVTISRNGDLVSNVYVEVVSNGIIANTVDGHTLVSNVECEIGGQRIDYHETEWLQVWSELTTTAEKAHGYKFMVGAGGMSWGSTLDGANTGPGRCLVPLRFWFCRNPGLALPLIALQYHEVKLKFTWGAATTNSTATVWCDYIYLDTDERRRFAQVSHEYLIEQLQIQSEGTSKASHKLNFNHPVKELIWTEGAVSDNTTKCKLVLNGHDRFAEQHNEYFRLLQPYEYHTSTPRQNIIGEHAGLLSGIGHVLDASGVTTSYDPSNALTTETYIAMSDATTIAAGDAIGSRNFIQVSEAQASAFTVGHHYFTMHTDASSNLLVLVPYNRCTFVSAAGSNGAKVIGFYNDIHSGEASQTGDLMEIFALEGDTAGLIEGRTSSLNKKIHVYSFALKPEEHQPSGTCNFSRIDNAQLNFSGTPPTLNNIYAVNYNVLRIMSGMGGLAYSN